MLYSRPVIVPSLKNLDIRSFSRELIQSWQSWGNLGATLFLGALLCVPKIGEKSVHKIGENPANEVDHGG